MSLSARNVILSTNCSVQLGGLVDTMLNMSWNVGKEYETITIGLDPEETMERATNTKEGYLERYGRKDSDKGWHFLRGDATELSTRLGRGVGTLLPDVFFHNWDIPKSRF